MEETQFRYKEVSLNMSKDKNEKYIPSVEIDEIDADQLWLNTIRNPHTAVNRLSC